MLTGLLKVVKWTMFTSQHPLAATSGIGYHLTSCFKVLPIHITADGLVKLVIQDAIGDQHTVTVGVMI